MPSPPYEFEKLAVPKGAPLRAVLSARWYALLARTLKAICPVVTDGGNLAIDYTPAGAVIRLTRPVTAYRLVRVGAGGIPGRDPATGANGEATVTNYQVETVAGVRKTTLGTSTTKAVNDVEVPVPANVDAKCVEEGGALIIIGWVCPD
jgi:hypothetical protein